MKVVVVGGMGFLGSHICEMYKKIGEEVVAIDNLTKYEYMRTPYNADELRKYNVEFLKNKKVVFHKEDVRDKNMMEKLCKDADYIINCSAQPSMTISIENPVLDYTTNVTGLLNLLEIARKEDIPISHCSTIHVFGNNINKYLIKETPKSFGYYPAEINEDHKILDGAISPLHSSKRAGEIYMQCYHETYGLKTLCARLSGIYGERQMGGEDHGWVANFTIRTIMDMPIKIFGTDCQVRDILYVKDASRIFKKFYRYQKSGIYNCGGGITNKISLRECLSLIQTLTHKKQYIRHDVERYGDLWYFVSDNSLIKEKLNWYPLVHYKLGLKKLVKWVSKNKCLFKVI